MNKPTSIQTTLAKAAFWAAVLLWVAAGLKLGFMIYQHSQEPHQPPAVEQPAP